MAGSRSTCDCTGYYQEHIELSKPVCNGSWQLQMCMLARNGPVCNCHRDRVAAESLATWLQSTHSVQIKTSLSGCQRSSYMTGNVLCIRIAVFWYTICKLALGELKSVLKLCKEYKY